MRRSSSGASRGSWPATNGRSGRRASGSSWIRPGLTRGKPGPRTEASTASVVLAGLVSSNSSTNLPENPSASGSARVSRPAIVIEPRAPGIGQFRSGMGRKLDRDAIGQGTQGGAQPGRRGKQVEAGASAQPAGDFRAQCRRKSLGAELAAEIRGPGCRILQKRIDRLVDRLGRPDEARIIVPAPYPIEQHRS